MSDGRARWLGRMPALPALVLVAIIGLALALRLAYLVPPERGVFFAADADEGMHAFDASLALQGYMPFRDYLCSIPPLSLYLFMGILGPTSQLWGNELAFMILRYVSVLYGLVTIAIVYGIGARLGGRGAGLLAAALLAIDGWAVAQDRRFMVEPPMNMFSALAILALVEVSRRDRRSLRWPALAGALAAAAMLTKSQGLIVPAVVVLTLALQRRWQQAAISAGAAVATYVLFSLPFLLTVPDDFVRNLFVFQFLRPPNGDPALWLRANAIRNFPESWLSVRLGLLGAAVLALRWLWSLVSTRVARLRAWQSETHAAWLPVIVWFVLIIALFASSKSFYLYYYAQLAVPLALLGGSLLAWHDAESRSPARALLAARLAMVGLIGLLVVWRGPLQLQATIQGTRWVKSAYVEMGRYIKHNLPAAAPVLAFEPNYVFLGEHPLARLGNRAFPVDMHASMLYINLGIKEQSWSGLLQQVLQRRMVDEQSLLWQQPAQDAILQADASYVIIDHRARYVLSPETLQAIEASTVEVAQFSDVVLRKKQ